MKKMNIVTSLLMALALLLALGITSVNAATTFVILNCSYDSTTPTNGVQLESAPQYATAGETYTTQTRDDITFTIRARVNSNYTNVTTYPPVLVWDNIERSTTVQTLGASNTSLATNASIILSNETDYTHSYYMRFFVNNASIMLLGNITSCNTANGASCTQYGVNDTTYPNITRIDCPTRQITLHYNPSGIPQQPVTADTIAQQEEAESNTTAGIILFIIAISAFIYLAKKGK